MLTQYTEAVANRSASFAWRRARDSQTSEQLLLLQDTKCSILPAIFIIFPDVTFVTPGRYASRTSVGDAILIVAALDRVSCLSEAHPRETDSVFGPAEAKALRLTEKGADALQLVREEAQNHVIRVDRRGKGTPVSG
jgi:hypothetical protein